jgi:circadian clock protein KaiC
MVVKMRAGDHSKDIREYEITSDGFQIDERLTGYRGLITGVPEPVSPTVRDSEQVPDKLDRKD